MKKQKQIFYKSVTHDYHSIHAPGSLRRKYEVGKTYRFSKLFPAYVFQRDAKLSDEFIFISRPEPGYSARVLVCEGYCEERGAFVALSQDKWNLIRDLRLDTVLVSTYFKVIREITFPIDPSLKYERSELLDFVTEDMIKKVKAWLKDYYGIKSNELSA